MVIFYFNLYKLFLKFFYVKFEKKIHFNNSCITEGHVVQSQCDNCLYHL